ncbi:MAG TPA: Ig-like domain-containing protein [Acidimicrobiales bacterium]
MSMQHDPELDDVLQDQELIRLAELLRGGRMSDPPLDDAFRSALRRQLMNRAWGMGGGGAPWWQKAFGPAPLAWAGAAAGVVLIAAVVIYNATNPSTGGFQVDVTSPMSDQSAVRLQQPILVKFNQPMDHASTEAAVQITPATTVAYSWDANTLAVLPTSNGLAPNTQYQVTVGPGAKTASGQFLSAPKTITFVTQPPPSPSPTPSPSPSPTPRGVLTGLHLLANVQGGITNVVWSSDSSTVYFIAGKAALQSVAATGGEVTVIAPDGVTSAAISPAGDQLAYVRNGKIEILTLAPATTTEIVPTTTPVLIGWVKGAVWAAADGIYTLSADGPVKLIPLPTGSAITVNSLSPDGSHLAFTQDQSLKVLDISNGNSVGLGVAGAQFLGWSPDGTGVMYSGPQAVVTSDVFGKTISTLPTGEPSWSSVDEIILGSDTDLWEVSPDGTGLTKLAEGSYENPIWAPNGTAFTYFRAGALYTASAPLPATKPSALDAAASVVKAFMDARKAGQLEKATALLDDNGRKVYAGSNPGLSLLAGGDPSFSRYYLLTQEITGTQPDTAQFVVRLVFSHNKIDVSTYEETLTLVRTQGSQQFLVDQSTIGPTLALGKGAEVVSVEVSPGTVKVTFDSDLKPSTVSGCVPVISWVNR